jgi:hypothetical protein
VRALVQVIEAAIVQFVWSESQSHVATDGRSASRLAVKLPSRA